MTAIISKIDSGVTDFENHLRHITPYTKLSYSELFTGNNAGVSLESELKKEILSSNHICFLVSFIKWFGIRIFEKELVAFTENGGTLKVITTSYMGATDLKAIQFLAGLNNTEVKVSYNTSNERLHAKAYLFKRNTGFDTGYIGSSNLSKSALTSGLEWNIKVTTQEIRHIIDKFQKTFDSYWQNKDFELFDKSNHSEKLGKALTTAKNSERFSSTTYFDLKPYPFQEEILEKLIVERTVHSRFKNLVVAATGTGKTIISAFDYRAFKKQKGGAKLLFIAHRREILQQARATFQGVLKDNNFGELCVDGIVPLMWDHVFASVQSFSNHFEGLNLSTTFYDFIIIDEVHHIAASSYRPILSYFKPTILLGLTATPERMDGENILKDFCNTIAAEIRLPEALNKGLLCPFQYFGVSETLNYEQLEWRNGRYLPSELTKIYTQNDERIREIIQKLDNYLNDVHDVRALCFCVTIEHAQYMAQKFALAGFKAAYLASTNNHDREDLKRELVNKEINYLFTVDMFNEGVDIPEVDTVLFLRPTESLTIFLQQFGRGLRLSDGKECLTVIDFVGNSRPEYDFESKFRGLIGKTNTPIAKEIENDFPHLPLGCSINLEKLAKEYILKNIRSATSYNKHQLLNKIINYKNQTSLPLTLRNFATFYNLPLQVLYSKNNWSRLCVLAKAKSDFPDTLEKEITRAIKTKWLSGNSYSYFQFILKLARQNFDVNFEALMEEEKIMCLMLHYDVWQEPGGDSLEESIKRIGQNEVLTMEIIELLEILIDKIDFLEMDIKLSYTQPLKVHGRFTRDQILAAFGFHTFDNKSNNREGVAFSDKKRTELLFITLDKSEDDYSPSTLYEDFAINETLFHWQSQNAVRPDKGRGLAYINHIIEERKILLFVRERNEDEFGNTMAFVFLGEGIIEEYSGKKPMSIKWRLQEPMPPFIWKQSAKMVVG